jgi:hypothetical protein
MPFIARSALSSAGQLPLVAGDRLPRNAVEMHRADVVAEGVPGLLHVADVGGGQRLERRVAAEELVVLRDHAVDLRLLEHDLRHEDVVGIAGPAPRQVALVPRVPAEETLAKASECSRVRD